MFSMILLSGGCGSRFSVDLPKQYHLLGSKPVILHSFDTFNKASFVDEIVVVCDPHYQQLFPSSPKIKFAHPGKRRQDSVFNGFKASSGNWIGIHDGARPFVPIQDVLSLFELVQTTRAGALATRVTSTIKDISHGVKTLDRDHLIELQTPQIIERNLLREGFEWIDSKNLAVTDDLSIVEAIGITPSIVYSSKENIKITTPSDLTIATALLKSDYVQI